MSAEVCTLFTKLLLWWDKLLSVGSIILNEATTSVLELLYSWPRGASLSTCASQWFWHLNSTKPFFTVSAIGNIYVSGWAYQLPCIKVRMVRIDQGSSLAWLGQLSSLCHFAKCLSVPTSLNTPMDPNRCSWSNMHKLPLGDTVFSKSHTAGWLKHPFYCEWK